MVRDVEIRVVRHVEELAANLEAVILVPERDGPGEREIEVGERRADENVPSGGAKERKAVLADGGLSESAEVEPAPGW